MVKRRKPIRFENAMFSPPISLKRQRKFLWLLRGGEARWTWKLGEVQLSEWCYWRIIVCNLLDAIPQRSEYFSWTSNIIVPTNCWWVWRVYIICKNVQHSRRQKPIFFRLLYTVYDVCERKVAVNHEWWDRDRECQWCNLSLTRKAHRTSSLFSLVVNRQNAKGKRRPYLLGPPWHVSFIVYVMEIV